ncbi:MAG: gliding motility-associated C-terminal domain-containing protein [Bacteroidota bacterium]
MRLLILLILVSISAGVKAQTISRQVISSTGGQTSNGSFTVGQIEFVTISEGETTLTQGFQQPEEMEEDIVNEAGFELLYPSCYLSNSLVEIKLTDFICDGEVPEVSLNGTIISEPYFIGVDQFTTFELVYPNSACNITLDIDAAIPVGLEPCPFEIPTLVTPNNDMVNDQWQLVNANSTPNSGVSIYSKWGEEVYRFTGDDVQMASWDGNDLNGNVLPTGVYFFILDIGEEQFKGTINLLR